MFAKTTRRTALATLAAAFGVALMTGPTIAQAQPVQPSTKSGGTPTNASPCDVMEGQYNSALAGYEQASNAGDQRSAGLFFQSAFQTLVTADKLGCAWAQ